MLYIKLSFQSISRIRIYKAYVSAVAVHYLDGNYFQSTFSGNNQANLRRFRKRLRGPPSLQTQNKIRKPGQKVCVGQPRLVGLNGKNRPHSHPGNSLEFQELVQIWVGSPGCILCAGSWLRVPPRLGRNRISCALWNETSLGGSCNTTYKGEKIEHKQTPFYITE